jgi:hypothetical protein
VKHIIGLADSCVLGLSPSEAAEGVHRNVHPRRALFVIGEIPSGITEKYARYAGTRFDSLARSSKVYVRALQRERRCMFEPGKEIED